MTLASFYDSHRIKRVTLETMTDPLSKALRQDAHRWILQYLSGRERGSNDISGDI